MQRTNKNFDTVHTMLKASTSAAMNCLCKWKVWAASGQVVQAWFPVKLGLLTAECKLQTMGKM